MKPRQTCEGWSELPVWNGLDGFKQRSVALQGWESSGVQVSVIALVYCVKWLLNPHGNTEASNLLQICPLRFAMAKINIYIFLCTPVHSPIKQMAPEVAQSEVCSLQEAGAN